MATIPCKICNKEVEKSLSVIKRNANNYCSWKCYSVARIGVSPAHKGKKISFPPEWYKHHKENSLKIRGENHHSWKGGKPRCSECDVLLSNYHNKKCNKCGGLSGSNSPYWKGGISKIDKLCREMREYKQWRSDCFIRDKWTCQTCQSKGYVTVHHIKGFSKILRENNIKDILDARNCEELWDIKNGVTLCEECHSLTDNYKGRGKNKTNICQQQ